jgi:hypothetical protein
MPVIHNARLMKLIMLFYSNPSITAAVKQISKVTGLPEAAVLRIATQCGANTPDAFDWAAFFAAVVKAWKSEGHRVAAE